MRDPDEETFSDGTPVPPEPPAEPGKGKGPTPAQRLVEMAEDTYRLIRGNDGRSYAVPRIGAPIAVPLASRSDGGLRARLSASLHRTTGQVASGSALADAVTVLAGEASELDPVPVWLRTARHGDAIAVDMGTATGQCIVITRDGWNIEAESPVVFRRSALIHPLAEPERGGTLDALRALMNLSDEDFRLAVAWVVAAYFCGIPHPILLVQGEQGTAKSSLVRSLLALVDPQPAAERTPPKTERDWAIFASASWAFAYDNVTDIPDWFSNALCKGVTGEAVLQRVLHTDDDIGIYSFQRVMAITTIAIQHQIAGDLADRMLLIEPDVIDSRLTETEVRERRAAALPGALGAVLDLVSGVLRELPAVVVDDPPRMADFARILAALDAATGWDTLGSYRAKTGSLALSLIEGSTFAYAVYRLATAPGPDGAEPAPWEGTAGELLTTLRQVCADMHLPASELPEDVRAVGRQVREIAPSLRKAGVDVRSRKSGSRRLLRITRVPGPPGSGDGSLLLLFFLELGKDMSHMSQCRVTAGHSAAGVGHHRRGQRPSMSQRAVLMSHPGTREGQRHVPASALATAPKGHVGHENGPFPIQERPAHRPGHRTQGGGGCLHAARGQVRGRRLGIPRPPGHPRTEYPTMHDSANFALALRLAARGWHILPLSFSSKRPLGNCPACTAGNGLPAHQPEDCPCIPARRWCHGVRAASADPATLTAWWRKEPRAVPGIATGPSGLVLLDIDAHEAPLPADPATGLLPGIDLAAELADDAGWKHGRYRDGRDALRLLARLRGGPAPWPADPAREPVSTLTPSGGAHLWYQAPADNLRQALTDPGATGRYGLAWQVDVKAGWSYGIAPGAITASGTYQTRPASPAVPGRMPGWLAREVIRACTPAQPSVTPVRPAAPGTGPGPAAYLTTVINRGTYELAGMKDGRKRALSKLAYHSGGLLEWSGLSQEDIAARLVRAGTNSGLKYNDAVRIVTRAISNGISRPISDPGSK